MQRILIVDDDPSHTTALRSLLEDEGYEVELGRSAKEARSIITQERCDLVILDVVLPDMDGLELCQQIRQHWTTPILFISRQGRVGDRIKGLKAGGDDYIAKPWEPNEVLARIWALLRRSGQLGDGTTYLENTALTLDAAQNTVQLMGTGKTVSLTPIETRLLGIFMDNSGRTITRDVLTIKVWGNTSDLLNHQLDAYIGRLRNKIEQNPSEPRLIMTVRGIGYRFQLNHANTKHR